MNATPATVSSAQEPWSITGNMGAQARETHTGLVVLVGDKAYKAKKPVTTDFLDFSTTGTPRGACEREVTLNRRLAPTVTWVWPTSQDPRGGTAEPVIVMRRYADSARLTSLVKTGQPVHDHLTRNRGDIGALSCWRDRGVAAIDAQGTVHAVSARWQQNLAELQRYADGAVSAESIA